MRHWAEMDSDLVIKTKSSKDFLITDAIKDACKETKIPEGCPRPLEASRWIALQQYLMTCSL